MATIEPEPSTDPEANGGLVRWPDRALPATRPRPVQARVDDIRAHLEDSRARLRAALEQVRAAAHELTPAAQISHQPFVWVAGAFAFGLALGIVTATRS